MEWDCVLVTGRLVTGDWKNPSHQSRVTSYQIYFVAMAALHFSCMSPPLFFPWKGELPERELHTIFQTSFFRGFVYHT